MLKKTWCVFYASQCNYKVVSSLLVISNQQSFTCDQIMQKLMMTMVADDAVRQTVRLRLIISAGVLAGSLPGTGCC